MHGLAVITVGMAAITSGFADTGLIHLAQESYGFPDTGMHARVDGSGFLDTGASSNGGGALPQMLRPV